MQDTGSLPIRCILSPPILCTEDVLRLLSVILYFPTHTSPTITFCSAHVSYFFVCKCIINGRHCLFVLQQHCQPRNVYACGVRTYMCLVGTRKVTAGWRFMLQSISGCCIISWPLRSKNQYSRQILFLWLPRL